MNSDLLDRQRKSFDSLVASGVYDDSFDHPAKAKAFVGAVVRRASPRLARRSVLNVLDCGCGTGAWLTFLHAKLTEVGLTQLRLYGFDLSERMVEVARRKLHGLAAPEDIRLGNVLEPQSYAFDGLQSGFDLIFTYDVVQQLPRSRQIEFCDAIADALAPGGVALILDNESESPFGRRMAVRKFLTRYCGLRLVPDYYCNASYPRLKRLRSKIERERHLHADIIVRDDGVKRAMVVAREVFSQGKAGPLTS